MKKLFIVFAFAALLCACTKKEKGLSEAEKEEVIQLETEAEQLDSEAQSIEEGIGDLDAALEDLDN